MAFELRRQRKTLHEELLEKGARGSAETDESRSTSEMPDGEQGRGGMLPGVVALVVLVVSVLVHFAPVWWVQALLAIIGLGYAAASAARSRKTGVRARIRLIRGLFLVWLAVSVASTVLVALGGFYREDLVLLAVVWTILAVLWLVDRVLRPSATPT